MREAEAAGYHCGVLAKGVNGNGACKTHPSTPTLCRGCLVEHLREFRHANVRAGLHLAAERISKLRDKYASSNGSPVASTAIAYELGALLSELQRLERQVAAQPVSPSLVLLLTREAGRHQHPARE